MPVTRVDLRSSLDTDRYPTDPAPAATPGPAPCVSGGMKRLLAGVVTFVVLVAGVLYYLSQLDDATFLATHGCTEGPLTAQAKNDGYTWPYGLVHSCRVLDDSRSLFSGQETVVLLIGTDRGSVLLHVEYSDLDKGRQYQAKATEIESAGGLSRAEKEKLQADLRARNGISSTPWTLAYGDG